MQVQLNFAAVVETLVSSGPQVKYVGRNGKPTEQSIKSKSLHCHVRPSTVPKEITMLHGSNTFLLPRILSTDQTFSSRHWIRSNGIIRDQKGNGTIVGRVRKHGEERLSRPEATHEDEHDVLNLPPRTLVLGVCTHEPTPAADPWTSRTSLPLLTGSKGKKSGEANRALSEAEPAKQPRYL